MPIQFTVSGSFDRTEHFLARLKTGRFYSALESCAQAGVDALEAATPEDTGATAASWSYEIDISGSDAKIYWTNSHLDEEGTPIAILLQMGHGTGTGGYVQGRDYINPAMRPVFDQIEQAVWKEVTSA